MWTVVIRNEYDHDLASYPGSLIESLGTRLGHFPRRIMKDKVYDSTPQFYSYMGVLS